MKKIIITLIVLALGAVAVFSLASRPDYSTPEGAIRAYLDKETLRYKITELSGPVKIPNGKGKWRMQCAVTCEATYPPFKDLGNRMDGINHYFFYLEKEGEKWRIVSAGTGP